MDVCKYANCDVTNIIMKYLTFNANMFSNYDDYNMQMRTTKCLNTAVMLTNILGGSDKLKTVEYCEVSKINNRYEKENKLQHKLNIFNELKKDLENKK